jgi:hypothetical protein
MKGHARSMLRLALVAGGLLAGADAGRADPTLEAMDGHWRGGGFDLTIDAARSQARIDPKKPFQWEAFAIRNVSGGMVVFTVGPRLFIAYLGADELTLTSPGLEGSRLLQRAGKPSE